MLTPMVKHTCCFLSRLNTHAAPVMSDTHVQSPDGLDEHRSLRDEHGALVVMQILDPGKVPLLPLRL